MLVQQQATTLTHQLITHIHDGSFEGENAWSIADIVESIV
jgi:hypothetical protein